MWTILQSALCRALRAIAAGKSDEPEPEPTISRSSLFRCGSVISPT